MVTLHLWQHFGLLIHKLAFIASWAHRLRLDPLFLHGSETGRLMNATARTRREVARAELRATQAVNLRSGDRLAKKRGVPHRRTLTTLHRLIFEQSWFSF